jgi:mono/diheme cytochrome c family protein
MIQASCHTADNAFALEFDATPWFREADPQSILHLAEQGWSSAWIADALEARPGYEGLHRLIDYAAPG